jgi:hypothetical protein
MFVSYIRYVINTNPRRKQLVVVASCDIRQHELHFARSHNLNRLLNYDFQYLQKGRQWLQRRPKTEPGQQEVLVELSLIIKRELLVVRCFYTPISATQLSCLVFLFIERWRIIHFLTTTYSSHKNKKTGGCKSGDVENKYKLLKKLSTCRPHPTAAR